MTYYKPKPITIFYNFNAPDDSVIKDCKEFKVYSISDKKISTYSDTNNNLYNEFMTNYDMIEYLNIDDPERKINRLPNCPKNIKYLMLSDLHIDLLPDLPDGILNLHVNFNCLIELPNLPNTLKTIWCKQNKLINIPILPTNLTYLNLGNNYINEILELPPKLEELYINNNNLIKLPKLPDSLRVLDCNYNPLKSISILPNNLINLNLNNTEIELLPNIPDSLSSLEISNTNIKFLPSIRDCNIKIFNAMNSKLEVLPIITILDHHINMNKSNYAFTPLYYIIQKEYDGLPFKYIYYLREKQIKAANKIGKWYLGISYDPKYKKCRKRVLENYEEDYNE
jgi:hypothetical protein